MNKKISNAVKEFKQAVEVELITNILKSGMTIIDSEGYIYYKNSDEYSKEYHKAITLSPTDMEEEGTRGVLKSSYTSASSEILEEVTKYLNKSKG